MQNLALAKDYIVRCQKRLKALDLLYREKSFADVVRGAQEVVELALKALLRSSGVDFPRTHDVSGILKSEKARLPKSLKSADLERMAGISKSLRKDRELAFYGSEDLTPGEFYEDSDAALAMQNAEWVVKAVLPFISLK